ncbi:MAG: hypothetical protein H7338_16900 [Candidatus Sericytochromatia bacterium]|nr:hypothetical protein [Candidatus Sericytochromatia bacterium]
MLRRELTYAYEHGLKVWIYMGNKFLTGLITELDNQHVQVTKLSEGNSLLRDRYIVSLDRIDYISVNDTEEWSRDRLDMLLGAESH